LSFNTEGGGVWRGLVNKAKIGSMERSGTEKNWGTRTGGIGGKGEVRLKDLEFPEQFKIRWGSKVGKGGKKERNPQVHPISHLKAEECLLNHNQKSQGGES